MSNARFYAIITSLMLVDALSSLETSMIFAAIPAILREFGSMASVGWLLTGYALVQAASAAVAAPLGDIFGRRKVLMVLVFLCGAGSLVSALSQSLEMIVLGRALQGLTGAILPLCYGIARELTGKKANGAFWIGLLTGAYAFAAGLGFLAGGWLADMGNWRSIFIFTTGYSVLLLPLILLVIPGNSAGSGQPRRLDIIGAVLFAPAIASCLYGITMIKDWGFGDPRVWAFVISGLAVLAYWARYEYNHPQPLVDVRLLRRPKIAIGNLCAVFIGLGPLQLAFLSLLILQQPPATGVGLGVSATLAALFKLPSSCTGIVAAPFSGWIASRSGAHWATFHGALASAVAWLLMIFLHGSIWGILLCSILGAFGLSMLLASLPNLVLEDAPPERSSEVTGLVSVNRSLFLGIGALLMSMILGSSQVLDPKTGASFPTETAYLICFGSVSFLSLLIAGAAVALIVRESRQRSRARDNALVDTTEIKKVM